MAKTKGIDKSESHHQKTIRLRKRKRDFQAVYAKGVFFVNKHMLIDFLQQPDVVVRCCKSGVLNDDTEFIEIAIEGFNSNGHLTQWLEQ